MIIDVLGSQENAFEMRPISALIHSWHNVVKLLLKALNHFPQAGSHCKHSHERFMLDQDHQLVIVDGWGITESIS